MRDTLKEHLLLEQLDTISPRAQFTMQVVLENPQGDGRYAHSWSTESARTRLVEDVEEVREAGLIKIDKVEVDRIVISLP